MKDILKAFANVLMGIFCYALLAFVIAYLIYIPFTFSRLLGTIFAITFVMILAIFSEKKG